MAWLEGVEQDTCSVSGLRACSSGWNTYDRWTRVVLLVPVARENSDNGNTLFAGQYVVFSSVFQTWPLEERNHPSVQDARLKEKSLFHDSLLRKKQSENDELEEKATLARWHHGFGTIGVIDSQGQVVWITLSGRLTQSPLNIC